MGGSLTCKKKFILTDCKTTQLPKGFKQINGEYVLTFTDDFGLAETALYIYPATVQPLSSHYSILYYTLETLLNTKYGEPTSDIVDNKLYWTAENDSRILLEEFKPKSINFSYGFSLIRLSHISQEAIKASRKQSKLIEQANLDAI